MVERFWPMARPMALAPCAWSGPEPDPRPRPHPAHGPRPMVRPMARPLAPAPHFPAHGPALGPGPMVRPAHGPFIWVSLGPWAYYFPGTPCIHISFPGYKIDTSL